MSAIVDIPGATKKRMLLLLNLLGVWPKDKITSVDISEQTGWKDSLIRHDLWLLGYNKGVSNGYKYGLVECEKTMLPYRGGKKFARTKDFGALQDVVRQYAERYPIVVVDDFGYCITDIYMRGSWGDEKYRDQFEVYKEIAGRVYRFIEFCNDLPGEVIVYLTMHTDVDAAGNLVPATVGKLLNEKVLVVHVTLTRCARTSSS